MIIIITIGIYSNNQILQHELTNQIFQYFTDINKKFFVYYFIDQNFLLTANPCAIYIIDITIYNAPDMIESGKILNLRHPKSKIIYICETHQQLPQDYNFDNATYLIKPITDEKLFNCLNKILQTIKPKKALVPISRAQDEVICVDEILYVDIEKRNLCFHLYNGEKITSTAIRKSFKEEISKIINVNELFFASPTFLINLNYIKTIKNDQIIFHNGESLYLSHKLIKILRSALEEEFL